MADDPGVKAFVGWPAPQRSPRKRCGARLAEAYDLYGSSVYLPQASLPRTDGLFRKHHDPVGVRRYRRKYGEEVSITWPEFGDDLTTGDSSSAWPS